jgi:hypothetical protein
MFRRWKRHNITPEAARYCGLFKDRLAHADPIVASDAVFQIERIVDERVPAWSAGQVREVPERCRLSQPAVSPCIDEVPLNGGVRAHTGVAFRVAGSWRSTLTWSLLLGSAAYTGSFALAIIFDQPYGPMLVAALLVVGSGRAIVGVNV